MADPNLSLQLDLFQLEPVTPRVKARRQRPVAGLMAQGDLFTPVAQGGSANRRPRTQQEVLEIALNIISSNGGTVQKISRRTALTIRCPIGHEWTAKASTISRGSWCYLCVRVKYKYTLQEIHSFARKKGGQCLSTVDERLNSGSLVDWRCKAGHTWTAPVSSITRGSWCLECFRDVRRYSVNELRTFARRHGGVLLSTHITQPVATTKVKWRCAVGHEWESSVYNVRRKLWCNTCGAAQRGRNSVRKDGLLEAKALARRYNGECISVSYDGLRIPLRWRCDKGHEWPSRLYTVRRGIWCPQCKEHNRIKKRLVSARMLAERLNGECLSQTWTRWNDPLTWRCQNGHEWHMTLKEVRSGQWCSRCVSWQHEEICRLLLEQMYDVSFPPGKLKWLRNIHGKKLRLDGYSAEIGLAFEYHGKQHYEYVEFFHRNRRNLKRQQENDESKRTLCYQNNILLLEIPYWVGTDELPEWIEQQLGELGAPTPVNKPRIVYPVSFTGIATLQEIRDIAAAQGGSLLDVEYKGAHEKHRFRCAVGHEWLQTISSVKGGHWCRECYDIRAARARLKYTIDDMHEVARVRGGVFLSKHYDKLDKKYRWRCASGHEWWATALSVKLQKSWCRECADINSGRTSRCTIGDMHVLAASRGGQCLSDAYINAHSRLHWRCSVGHKWWASSNHIKRDWWCRICARIRRSDGSPTGTPTQLTYADLFVGQPPPQPSPPQEP